jgi:hypothetical protein
VFLVYLLGIVTTSVATRMAVAIGRRATLACAAGLSVAGLLMTLPPHLAWVVAGLAAMSGGLFVVQTLSLSFIAATTRRAKSTAVGLYVTLYYVGGGLGGLLPATVWHVAGWNGVVALLAAMMTAVGVVGVIAWREGG